MDFNTLLQDVHFADWKWMLILPAAMMLFDFITGFLGAWIHNDIQSPKMRSGLAKKCGELCVILIGQLFTIGMNLPQAFMEAISFYILFMETVSVVENLAIIGVRLPTRWTDKLEQVQRHYEKKEKEKKPEAPDEDETDEET